MLTDHHHPLFLSGMIKLVSKHRAQLIYTRNTKGGDEEAAAEKEKA